MSAHGDWMADGRREIKERLESGDEEYRGYLKEERPYAYWGGSSLPNHPKKSRENWKWVSIIFAQYQYIWYFSSIVAFIALTTARDSAMSVAEVGRVVRGSTQRVAKQFANL